jgi:hypothetical protein
MLKSGGKTAALHELLVCLAPVGYYRLRGALQELGFVLVFFPVPPFTRQAAGL